VNINRLSAIAITQIAADNASSNRPRAVFPFSVAALGLVNNHPRSLIEQHNRPEYATTPTVSFIAFSRRLVNVSLP